MKSLIFFTLITASVASTARADWECRALVGGLIGGIIIGSILDDDRHLHHHHTRIHHRFRGYDRHGGYGYNGHHDYISVKTWINGHWSVSYDRYGHCYRHWCPGYYFYDKRRVWVPHNRSHRRYNSPRHDHYDDHYRGIGTIDVVKLGRGLGKPLGIYREACLASSSNSTQTPL